MKIFVKYEDQLYTVPCGDGQFNIRSLTLEAIKRIESHTTFTHIDSNCCQLVMASNMAVLYDEDVVKDVLEDGTFVVLGMKGEISSSILNGASEIPLPTEKQLYELDGATLSPEMLVKIGKGCITLDLSKTAWHSVKRARALLDQIVVENRVVYGVTTGFGKFAHVVIEKDRLSELQCNLIRSHAVGVGEALSLRRTRMLFALRMNVLAKGHSGIDEETLQRMLNIFNASCLPFVPEKGTVGASGDLAPLAHLALGLLGEGKMWSPKTGWGPSSDVLKANNLKPLTLKPKEGIALINGTQLMTSLGAEALERCERIAKQADVVAALSLEALRGTSRAFSKEIHAVRPHKGQGMVAERLRSLLNSDIYPSEIAESHHHCGKVQDAYTLRCCPQVHGIVNDTLEFVRGILTTELNSATDNPMVFADEEEIISGGNFHGEYPAKALDYLAIGIHEIANMSERRLERLVNPAYSGLPAFLVNDGGFNSGFMMAQVTAAALVSENKVLCHPSSVDSLTTSAGTEDHVSMGGFAARKSLRVVEHVEQVLAIELLASCQGIDLLKPLKTTQPLQEVYNLVRSHVSYLEKDRYMAPDIEIVTKLLQEGKVWEVVEPYIEEYRKVISEGKTVISRPPSPTSVQLNPEPPAKMMKL